MVGPNANASMNLLSGYHGAPPRLVSPLQAMTKIWEGHSGKVLYSVGSNVSLVDNKGNVTPPAIAAAAIAAAVAVAKQADAVVLGLGLCGDNYGGGPPKEDSTCYKINEAESVDRANLTLPGKHAPDKPENPPFSFVRLTYVFISHSLAGAQLPLFRALLATGKPLVVFLMNAGPVDVAEIKASGVPIVAAGY